MSVEQFDEPSEQKPGNRDSESMTKHFGKRKNGRRRILFPLFAVGLSTLIAVVLAEVGLRLFVDQEAKRLATYDETLGWRGRPHGSGLYIRRIDNIRVPFHYNNLGFRDEDVTPKSKTGRRIMILGDSFVESLEVEFLQTFPSLLEQHLKLRSGDWDVAVVGSQGYSTAQELLAFRKYREVVSPDIVVLVFYCGNDLEDNLRQRYAYLDADGKLRIPGNEEPSWRHATASLNRWLYESSHVVFLLKNSLESMGHIRLAPGSKAAVDADKNYMQNITGQLIGKLAEEVREMNAKFRVVVIPCRDDLAAGNLECPAFVKKVCADHEIMVLDLSPVLSDDDFFPTDIHFSARGHEVVAQAIEEFLLCPSLSDRE